MPLPDPKPPWTATPCLRSPETSHAAFSSLPSRMTVAGSEATTCSLLRNSVIVHQLVRRPPCPKAPRRPAGFPAAPLGHHPARSPSGRNHCRAPHRRPPSSRTTRRAPPRKPPPGAAPPQPQPDLVRGSPRLPASPTRNHPACFTRTPTHSIRSQSTLPAAHKKSPPFPAGFSLYPGNVLLSHALPHAVPSGLRGLTSVFGMGTGVSPSLQSPERP